MPSFSFFGRRSARRKPSLWNPSRHNHHLGIKNAIRPTALGKKNWLFVGDAATGQRGAILYTIIESCRRRGIDPHAYLRNALTRLPSMTNWQIKDVTPAAWAKAQRLCATAAVA